MQTSSPPLPLPKSGIRLSIPAQEQRKRSGKRCSNLPCCWMVQDRQTDYEKDLGLYDQDRPPYAPRLHQSDASTLFSLELKRSHGQSISPSQPPPLLRSAHSQTFRSLSCLISLNSIPLSLQSPLPVVYFEWFESKKTNGKQQQQ
jgi:hypothetical protein